MSLRDFFRRFQGRARGERPLFRTSTPPFQARQWDVGELVEWEGRVYLVTRWVELPPVPLTRGGSVQQWEIWGEPLAEESLEAEVSRAAERILREAERRDRSRSRGDQAPGPGGPEKPGD
ncbi:MAG: hypothetical protein M5U22_20095 [Thermoleophilia bacterium]|nr:hypothetical protein [Thermoleophilia bacterium]